MKIVSIISAALLSLGLAFGALAETAPVGNAPAEIQLDSHWKLKHAQNRFSATVTSNWSGYVVTGQSYTSTSARWKVPAVTAWGQTNSNPFGYEYNTIWIGIGGFNDQTLIQLGTETMVDQSGNQMQFVWYELYPAVSVSIPKSVSAGDIMTASITCTGNCTPGQTQTWLLSMSDVTKGWTWSQSFQFASSMVSAEWVVESPYYNGWLPLNNYGQATFDSVLANGVNPGLTPGNALALNDQPGGQTSNPSDPLNGNQFSTCWGFGSYTVCPVGSVDGNPPPPPPPAAPTASLTANPATIPLGQSAALNWGSTNATSCAGTGFDTGLAVSGSATVGPLSTTSYSVACSGAGGTASATAAVSVQQPPPPVNPPPTVSMTGLPSWINAGQTSVLRWTSTNATSCSGNGFPASLTTGKATIAPTATTIYTLTCTGAGGSTSVSSTVNVRWHR